MTTISPSTSLILVDTRLGSKTFILPSVTQNSGRILLIKDYYGTSLNSTIVLKRQGSDLIDNFNSDFILSNAFSAVTLFSDGISSWRILSLFQSSLPNLATGLSISVNATGTATLSWTPGINSTYYNWVLYVSAGNNYSGTVVDVGTTFNKSVTVTIRSSGYYYFTIVSVNSIGSAAITVSNIILSNYSPVTVYNYIGADQTYNVPATDVSVITVSMWGAGGPGGAAGNYGGGGAFVNGNLLVSPGQSMRVVVGQGGSAGATSSYGGGGFVTSFGGWSGGGRSAIQLLQIGIVSGASASGGIITFTTSIPHVLQEGQGFIITNLLGGSSPFNISGIVNTIITTTSFNVRNTTTGASLTNATGNITSELVDVGGGGGGADCGGGAFSGSGGIAVGGFGRAEQFVTGGTQIAAGSGGGGGPGVIFQGGSIGAGNGGQAGGGGGGFFPGGSGGGTSRASGGGSSYTTYNKFTLKNSSAGAAGSGTTPVGTADPYYVSGINAGTPSNSGLPGLPGRVVIYAGIPPLTAPSSLSISSSLVSGTTYNLTLSWAAYSGATFYSWAVYTTATNDFRGTLVSFGIATTTSIVVRVTGVTRYYFILTAKVGNDITAYATSSLFTIV
jgi:hypothetical protein